MIASSKYMAINIYLTVAKRKYFRKSKNTSKNIKF